LFLAAQVKFTDVDRTPDRKLERFHTQNGSAKSAVQQANA
jgi:hypothetical protein